MTCRGNCILVGSLGQPLESLAQIALYIAGYELQLLDSSSESKFNESFRALFRQAGLEGKALAIIVTVRTLHLVSACVSHVILILIHISAGKRSSLSICSRYIKQCNVLWRIAYSLYQ